MFDCKEIIIFVIYGYILFYVLKKDQYIQMILLTFGTYMLLIHKKEGLKNEGNEGNKGNTPERGETAEGEGEGFENEENKGGPAINPNIATNGVKDDGGEIKEKSVAEQLSMGPYDGICLKTGNEEYWMKSPGDTNLIPDEQLYSYLGSQGPVKMRLSDQSALMGPPIDGVKGSAEKKFMFANNKSSLACCPSTFSTSTGCVCSTKNQRDFIASRGVLEDSGIPKENEV